VTEAVTLAAAAWQIERHRTWSALEDKLERSVTAAAKDGATVLCLPEYAGLEAALVDAPRAAPAEDWCRRSVERADAYRAACINLAEALSVTLLTGSLVAKAADHLVNRAWLCTPDGRAFPTDKQILTPWERAHVPLRSGDALATLDAPFGRLAALICYDSEFPALAQAIAADILMIPSCTDTGAGQTRVRIAARARALEAQGVSLHAPLIGDMPGCPIIDQNRGQAAIFTPPDHPFPASGILAELPEDTAGWAIATVPAGALNETRSRGHVAPRAHSAQADTRASAIKARLAGEVGP